MTYNCCFYYTPIGAGYAVTCINLPVGGFGWSREEATEELRTLFLRTIEYYYAVKEPIPWQSIELPFWASQHSIEVEVPLHHSLV